MAAKPQPTLVIQLGKITKPKSKVPNQMRFVSVEVGELELGESSPVLISEVEEVCLDHTIEYPVFFRDEDILAMFINYPLLFTYAEMPAPHGKEKPGKQPEMKDAIVLGQCSIDMLPLIVGDTETLEGPAVLENLDPNIPASAGGSVQELHFSVSVIHPPMIPADMWEEGNIMSVCMENLFNTDAAGLKAASKDFQIIAGSRLPMFKHPEQEVLQFMNATMKDKKSNPEDNHVKKWNALSHMVGKVANMKDVIDEDMTEAVTDFPGNIFFHILDEARHSNRLLWNSEKRFFMTGVELEMLRHMLEKGWPFEVVVQQCTAGSKLRKKKGPDDEDVSYKVIYHGTASADLSQLLFPGVFKVRGAFKLQKLKQDGWEALFGNREPVFPHAFEQPPSVGKEDKEDTKTTVTAADTISLTSRQGSLTAKKMSAKPKKASNPVKGSKTAEQDQKSAEIKKPAAKQGDARANRAKELAAEKKMLARKKRERKKREAKKMYEKDVDEGGLRGTYNFDYKPSNPWKESDEDDEAKKEAESKKVVKKVVEENKNAAKKGAENNKAPEQGGEQAVTPPVEEDPEFEDVDEEEEEDDEDEDVGDEDEDEGDGDLDWKSRDDMSDQSDSEDVSPLPPVPFITFSIEFYRSLTSRRSSAELGDKIASYITPFEKKPLYVGGLAIAEERFQHCIQEVADFIIALYEDPRGEFQPSKIESGEPETPEDEVNLKFKYFLNTSGYFTSIKKFVMSGLEYIVNRNIPKEFKSDSEFKAFMSRMYTYTIGHAHMALNTYIKGQMACEVGDIFPADAQLEFAKEAACEGKIRRAKMFYEKVLVKYEKNCNMWLEYATFQLAHDPANATHSIRTAIGFDQTNKFGLLMHASICMDDKRFEEAEMFFQANAELYDTSVLCYVAMGLYYASQGNLGFAKNCFSIATKNLKGDPKYKVEMPELTDSLEITWTNCQEDSVFLLAATTFIRLRLYSLASQAVKQHLLCVTAKDSEYLCYVSGVLLYMQDRYKESIEWLERGLQVNYLNAHLWTLLGHCHYKGRKVNRAIQEYETVFGLKNRPSNLHLLCLRFGILLQKKQMYNRAGSVLTIAVKRDVSTPYLWYTIGISLYEHGKIKEAEKAFTEANTMDNTNPSIWAYLCLTAHRLGKSREKESAFKFANQLNLKNKHLKKELNKLYPPPHINPFEDRMAKDDCPEPEDNIEFL